jgi:hypothetical protein
MTNGLARAVLLATALLSSGCYKMTFTNGRPAAAAPVVHDRWRSTTVLDVAEIDSPLPLSGLCKETGWARIEQRRDALNWLVDSFLAGIVYESTHADLYCAEGAPGGAAPAAPPPPKSTDL